MLTGEDKLTYVTILVIAATLGTVGGLLIVLLLFNAKSDNVYNFCVFGMSTGLLIYNCCDIYFLYYKVTVNNFWLVGINVIATT